MKTTLLMPTLNEIEGMRAMVPRIDLSVVDEVVLIDGGSTDGTIEYAREKGFRVLNQTTPGITGAYRDALPQLDGDVVIAFSPDGNSLPELIQPLIEKMREGYDMVIASRYLPGAKSEDDDWLTAFGNRLFTIGINLLFGGKYTDSLVMLRAFRREIPLPVPTNAPRAGLEPLLCIRCAKNRLKVAEIPGDEPKRIGGTRKMRPFLNGLNILWLMFQEFFRPRNPNLRVRKAYDS